MLDLYRSTIEIASYLTGRQRALCVFSPPCSVHLLLYFVCSLLIKLVCVEYGGVDDFLAEVLFESISFTFVQYILRGHLRSFKVKLLRFPFQHTGNVCAMSYD